MPKEPLYPHVPSGREPIPGPVIGKWQVKKPTISADFKNSISKQIVDETDAVREYETLAARAKNIYKTTNAPLMEGIDSLLLEIAKDERHHKSLLETLSKELAGK